MDEPNGRKLTNGSAAASLLWTTVLGVIVSGTIGFIGVWKIFSDYNEADITRIVTLEVTERDSSEWRKVVDVTIGNLVDRITRVESSIGVESERMSDFKLTSDRAYAERLRIIDELSKRIDNLEAMRQTQKDGDRHP